jgi:hypothetical protein
MKETANGLADQSLHAETAALIVDAQIETRNAKTTPFTNDHEKLDMASLNHEMKLDTENGMSIDLDILLHRIFSIFSFNDNIDKPAERETFQSVLMANATTEQHRTTFRNRTEREEP